MTHRRESNAVKGKVPDGAVTWDKCGSGCRWRPGEARCGNTGPVRD